MTIDSRRHTKRIEAGEHLIDLVARGVGSGDSVEVSQLACLDIHARATYFIDHEIQVAVPDADVELRFYRDEWPNVDLSASSNASNAASARSPPPSQSAATRPNQPRPKPPEPTPASANPGNTPPTSPPFAVANKTSPTNSRVWVMMVATLPFRQFSSSRPSEHVAWSNR